MKAMLAIAALLATPAAAAAAAAAAALASSSTSCGNKLPAIPRGRPQPDGSFQATAGVRLPGGAPWPHCGVERTRVPLCDVPGGDPGPVGARLLQDGSLAERGGPTWPAGLFWTDDASGDLLLCPCRVPPCVLKCCPNGYVIRDASCIAAHGGYSNATLLMDTFTMVPEERCQFGKYMLQLDDPGDAYFLLPSGYLFLNSTNETYVKSEFCMEYTTDQPNVIRAFICFPTPNDESKQDTKMFIIYPLFMILSEPFLIATFLVYAIVPELRNLHGQVIMSHVTALFFAYLNLIIVQLGGSYMLQYLCIVSAFIIYFAFLASFFWLNVMCLDIWWTFSGFRPMRGSMKEREHKKFIIYSLYCWGSPLIMLIIALIMDLHPGIPETYEKPGFGEIKCWFRSNLGNFIYFSGPIAILIVCNIVLFILTAFKIRQVKRGTKILKKQDSRRHNEEEENNAQRFNLYLKLFLVMGVNWIMEVISFAAGGPDEWWYVTDITNTLQGVLIFVIFVCKGRIRRLLMERFCPGRGGNINSTANSSSTRMTGIRRNGSVMSSGRSSLKTQEGHQMKALAASHSVRSDDSDVP